MFSSPPIVFSLIVLFFCTSFAVSVYSTNEDADQEEAKELDTFEVIPDEYSQYKVLESKLSSAETAKDLELLQELTDRQPSLTDRLAIRFTSWWKGASSNHNHDISLPCTACGNKPCCLYYPFSIDDYGCSDKQTIYIDKLPYFKNGHLRILTHTVTVTVAGEHDSMLVIDRSPDKVSSFDAQYCSVFQMTYSERTKNSKTHLGMNEKALVESAEQPKESPSPLNIPHKVSSHRLEEIQQEISALNMKQTIKEAIEHFGLHIAGNDPEQKAPHINNHERTINSIGLLYNYIFSILDEEQQSCLLNLLRVIEFQCKLSSFESGTAEDRKKVQKLMQGRIEMSKGHTWEFSEGFLQSLVAIDPTLIDRLSEIINQNTQAQQVLDSPG